MIAGLLQSGRAGGFIDGVRNRMLDGRKEQTKPRPQVIDIVKIETEKRNLEIVDVVKVKESLSAFEMYRDPINIKSLVDQCNQRLQFNRLRDTKLGITMLIFRCQQAHKLFAHLTLPYKKEFENSGSIDDAIKLLGDQRCEEYRGGDDEVSRVLRLATLIRDRNYQQFLIQKQSPEADRGKLKYYEKEISEFSEVDREKYQPEKFFIDDFGITAEEKVDSDAGEAQSGQCDSELIKDLSVRIGAGYATVLKQYEELYQGEIGNVKEDYLNAAILDFRAALRKELQEKGAVEKFGQKIVDDMINEIIIISI